MYVKDSSTTKYISQLQKSIIKQTLKHIFYNKEKWKSSKLDNDNLYYLSEDEDKYTTEEHVKVSSDLSVSYILLTKDKNIIISSDEISIDFENIEEISEIMGNDFYSIYSSLSNQE